MKFLHRNILLIWSCLVVVEMIHGKDIESDEESSIAKREKKDNKSLCQGLPGLPGRDGRDGRDAGLRGPPGRRGPAGPRGEKGEAAGSRGGTVYTRWGRKHCPQISRTNELYSGVMAGSRFNHKGGASNYLCLPLNPIFDKVKAGNQGGSYIYGTEYETQSYPYVFPQNIVNHDAPCAVCHTESRDSHVMIPARNVCPSGWTLEYKGYLMSEHYNHKGRTQFLCVDENAEATTGSHVDYNGALLYFVESQCGSLPCPPYATGKELTCVVCTK
ncbi:short-chain collagen C4-like [Dendronephthya gigantea]|uniref:short-chain collagen C4-like n=1 Tax=Dendronephthya gigantea TaxID=151771 RepID=UPI00106BE4A8|nr:short-chain collagen C4-like [Dendronephthya gigantea]